MKEGYFSLVLHAHLPYVRHREPDRLEERWLFEALTESYIPMLWELEAAQVQEALTISISPPVMEMLADPLLQTRYEQYLARTEELLVKEAKRTSATKEERDLTSFYQKRFQKITSFYLRWDKNVLNGFRALQDQNMIRCITSAATHAFLPYVKTKAAVRSQIVEALSCFERHFGHRPTGFWLPECAFAPGIDRILVEEGVRYTFVDEHALLYADPQPGKGSGAPVYSPHGLVLFPRHTRLSGKVWSSTLGYPGDADYREFYRDIAYERDESYILPYIHPEGIRIDTGIKHRRITGQQEEKATYVREWAEGKVHRHAADFVEAIQAEVAQHGGQSDPPYMMVTPFDAELFGHWWFEGPEWLGAVLRAEQAGYRLLTAETYVHRHYRDLETVHVSFSTWGREGYGSVWLNEKNEMLYRAHHRMERDLASVSALYRKQGALEERARKQLVREWMLAVSSDWAFILDGETASQYAEERFLTHLRRFDEIKERLQQQTVEETWLTKIEEDFPFLADVNADLFYSPHDAYIEEQYGNQQRQGKQTIMMLSWEFPPLIVGGLARHVFDLSRMLQQAGNDVHVITADLPGYPAYEVNQGVHVHRVKGAQPRAESFYDWVGSLNIAMYEYARKLARNHPFTLIHAHDWLVGLCATALKARLSLPLLATIHATEHGRNNGIHTDLQKRINEQEQELTAAADRVIVCSEFMKQELQTIFSLPAEKLTVIPNGVDQALIRTETENVLAGGQPFTVFSIGRMVKEKGFHTLLEAAALVKERQLDIRFVIAGKGPLLHEYEQQVLANNLEEYIRFLGFICDEERNEWLQRCDAAVFPSLYEPFGIVALEAMAAGVATIVAETGGLATIIADQINGLTFRPEDAEGLLTEVLDLYSNPGKRERLAAQARQDVQTTYSWPAIARQTEEEYSRCYTEKDDGLKIEKEA
ncbi:DUF1957 domain-containing protein [Alkalihalobacillus oceani]|uniref:DUF1957 domain-containing protein n=1 Tax=Halalkalibacter oceani TaxID=1653776 RepID=A0A9X2DPV2_9BACI|nr:DUF1957 domain-containing protein [Halalkalibacter oceani]